MNDRDLSVTEEELHADVDGQLPADRAAAVERWLAEHPDDMARVAAWRAQAEAIRARYAAVADEPVPARLNLGRLARPARSWKGVAAAATVAAFLVGGLAGWMARGVAAPAPSPVDVFTAEAMEAHRLYVVEVRHPVEVPGDEQPHLVQWLSKRLGYAIRIPDLHAIGLKLVGGRLLPGPTGAAAFFMYEGGAGERYTLYCARASGPDTAMRFSAAGALAAVYWAEGDEAFVMSGESDRAQLQKVAETAYRRMERATPR
jgi:anti-sigma factor RsiW